MSTPCLHGPAEFDPLAENYSDLLRDPWRDRFTSDPSYFVESKVKFICEFFQVHGLRTSQMDWLDIGCGRGDMLRGAGRLFRSATGCDPSRGMLAACSGLSVHLQPDPQAIPFTDSSFDFVTAVCVYHHVPPAFRAALTIEAFRVLRPSGVLCLIEHNPWNPVTRLIVRRTPVDAGAQLLEAPEAARLMKAPSAAHLLSVRYFLLLPARLKRLHPIEELLSRLPLGGQYGVFAQKRP